MSTVSELTYDIPIEFPIVKRYIPIRVIRGDDVTLRFTQPSGEDGFIAHEVQEIIPTAVIGKKDEVYPDKKCKPQQLDVSKLIPILVKSIQELNEKINTLNNK